jgi:regulator of RNase E activity RraB
MFSEPKHKQVSINEINKFSVLNHLLSSYIATLALYATEHFDELSDYEGLKKIAQNTENLLREAIKIIEQSEFVVKENIKIISLKTTKDPEIEGQILIPEQFINIQKVAYDICKISERIEV